MASPIYRTAASLYKQAKKVLFSCLPVSWYMRLYSRNTDHRIVRDPVQAVGGKEGVIVPMVLEYLSAAGLRHDHKLYDFGCGTLRVGAALIRMLDDGCYYGVDISEKAIEESRRRISEDRELEIKRPTVAGVAPFQIPLPSAWVPDYILCNSVFSHLPAKAAEQTFRQLSQLMGAGTTLVMSFYRSERSRWKTYKSVFYSPEDIRSLAATAGIDLTFLEGTWLPTQAIAIGRKR